MNPPDPANTPPAAEAPAAPQATPNPAVAAGTRLVGRAFFLAFLLCLGLTTQPALRTAGRIGIAALMAWLILMMWSPTRPFAMWPVFLFLVPWTFRRFLRLHEQGHIDPLAETPADHADQWRAAREWLLQNRFRDQGLWRISGHSTGLGVETDAVLAGFAGPQPGLSAAIYTERTRGRALTPPVLEFSWFFTDGRYLLVNNKREPGLWSTPPHQEILSFPGVDDPGELYRLARAARAEAPRPAPQATPEGDWPDLIALGHVRALAHWRRRGFITTTPDGANRPTVKGALKLMLTTVPPFSTLAKRRLRRRGDARRCALLEHPRA